MARADVPTPEKVRVLLTDQKQTPEDLDRVGDQFLEAGLPSVAVMFYDRTKSADRAKRVLDQALRDGDAFLLDWVTRVAVNLVTPVDWKRCAERALELKKNAFARSAFVRAGDLERASQIKE